MTKFFLAFFLYVIIFCVSVLALDIVPFKGADDPVEKAFRKCGISLPTPFLPSSLPDTQQGVENIRFALTGESQVTEGFLLPYPRLPHPQLEPDPKNFPQNALQAFIQILFPSPNETELAPNRSAVDLISKLSPGGIGMLCKLVMHPPADKDTLQKAIYDCLRVGMEEHPDPDPDGSLYCALHREGQYDKWRVVNYKDAVVAYHLRSQEDDYGRDPSDSCPYTALLNALYPDCLVASPEGPPLFVREETERYVDLLKSKRRRAKLTAEEIVDTQSVEEMYPILPQVQGPLSLYHFAHMCTQAIMSGLPPYCPNILPRALFLFAWMKARDFEQITRFYSALLGEDVPPDTFSRQYSASEYDAFSKSGRHSITLTPEERALCRVGPRIFTSPLPPPIPAGRTEFEGKRFTDCVESTLRFWVYCMAWCAGPHGYHLDSSIFPPGSIAHQYFTNLSSPSAALSEEGRDLWARLVSNRPELEYLKSFGGRANRQWYELKPGLGNLLRACMLVLSSPGDPTVATLLSYKIESPEAVEWATRSLTWLERFAQRKNPGTSFVLEIVEYNGTYEDLTGHVSIRTPECSASFYVDGYHAEWWDTGEAKKEPLWVDREGIDPAVWRDPEHVTNLLPLLPPTHLPDVLPLIPDSLRQATVFSLNLRDPKVVSVVIPTVLGCSPSGNRFHSLPLSLKRVVSLCNPGDYDGGTLFGPVIEETSFDDTIALLRAAPLGLSVLQPNGCGLLSVLMHKHPAWLLGVLPTVTILKVNPFDFQWPGAREAWVNTFPQLSKLRELLVVPPHLPTSFTPECVGSLVQLIGGVSPLREVYIKLPLSGRVASEILNGKFPHVRILFLMLSDRTESEDEVVAFLTRNPLTKLLISGVVPDDQRRPIAPEEPPGAQAESASAEAGTPGLQEEVNEFYRNLVQRVRERTGQNRVMFL